MNFPTPRDIERWIPKGLNQIAGNKAITTHFTGLLRSGCEVGSNTLIVGPSRSGKTACVKAYMRSLMCWQRSSETAAPCGRCDACKLFDVRFSEFGTFAEIHERVLLGGREPVHYFPVNCGSVTEAELRQLVSDAQYCNGLRLVFLDEVHRLVRRSMDHLLLVPMQDFDATWIAASATIEGLEEMFLNRFSMKFRTQVPSPTEMLTFLEDRSSEFHINVDTAATLELLSKRSRRIVGRALNVFAASAGRTDRTLTHDDVAHFPFFVDELREE